MQRADRRNKSIDNGPDKAADSLKLECPFCKNVSYARPYFFMKDLREKHNYRLSLDEERLAKETLGKAKGRVLLDETFLEEHRQDMTQGSATFLAERATFWLREPYFYIFFLQMQP